MSRARTIGAIASAVLLAAYALLIPGAATAQPSVQPSVQPSAITNVCPAHPAPHHFTCFALRNDGALSSAARYRPAAEAGDPDGYGPSDLSSAYRLAGAPSGAGRRIFVVDAYGDPTAASDLATYRSRYGLPACTQASHCFTVVNQRGSTTDLPSPDAGWAGETSLDLDVISAACPACSITLVEADDDGDNLLVAAREAATLGARFVSISWGGAEQGNESNYDSTYLRSTGVLYSVSTGDDGYGTAYPATSPLVVAVGGTSLTRSATTRGWSESAWSGAGSGCSHDEAKPAWQAAVSTSCSGRAVADLATVADPATGVAVYDSYQSSGWAVYGGTSAAAPLVAAIAARAGATGSKPEALPYSHTASFNDVTSGTNGSCTPSVLCHAGTGWDGPTGLGSPRGVAAFGGTDARNFCTGNLVGNGSFEARAAGWAITGARVQHGRAAAHSGTHFLRLGGHSHRSTVTRTVTVPAGCQASLSYYLRVHPGHGTKAPGRLVVRVDGHPATAFTNLNRSRHYQRHTLALGALAGHRVTLSWVVTGSGRPLALFDLDDIAVTLSS